jgi:hypothetical protein
MHRQTRNGILRFFAMNSGIAAFQEGISRKSEIWSDLREKRIFLHMK